MNNKLTIKQKYVETYYKDWKRNHDMLWDMDQKMLSGLLNEIHEKFDHKGTPTDSDLKIYKFAIKAQEDIRSLKSFIDGLYIRNESKIPKEIKIKEIKEYVESFSTIDKNGNIKRKEYYGILE